MPADIRSFFGGKSAAPKKVIEPAKQEKANGTKRKNATRKVIVDDSDDDEVVERKVTPKKAAPKRIQKESPKGEETTSSDYFASSKSSEHSKPRPKEAPAKATPTKAKAKSAQSTPSRASARRTAQKSYTEPDDDVVILDDNEEGGDDIFADDVRRGGRRKDDDYFDIDSDEEPVRPKTTIRTKKSTRPKTEDVDMKDVGPEEDFLVPDDDEVIVVDKPSKKGTQAGSKKRKSIATDDDEEEPKKKVARKPKAKKDDEPESAEIQAILANIPLVRAPTPPPKDPDAPKFDFRNAKPGGGNSGPPPAAGSKEIPTGEENCLAGLKFVFTGLLDTISRDEGSALVKRYGGEITGAPSGKTSYVVLGSDAGPSKLRKIQDLKIKTINEDGLFALIRSLPPNGGNGKSAAKFAEKKKADEEKVRLEAAAMEREEKRQQAEAQKKAEKIAEARGMAPPPRPQANSAATQLWTTKYAPTSMSQICGNKGQVQKIQKWLHDWPLNRRRKFQIRGADGTGAERAIIVHGPPGIGKTTAAHLAAKLEGYDVIESNASDTRSKKLVENGLADVLKNNSLMGYFVGDGHDEIDMDKKKIVLIMDEVDGMSAGDRGGVGALAKICKTTSIPMILICNDRKLPKMRPFDHVTFDVPFRRPQVAEVRSRIATICAREGLKLPVTVIDALIEGSHQDIRQIINMLSSAKLDQTAMDFDKTKQMSKAWEKHIILKPWDLCHKLLGGGLFAPASKATLNDKIELYFNDHEFSYLMIQQNYLSTKPMLANDSRSAKEHKLKLLELADKAAESISDGDLVDRMIHGSQQQWSLMPTHAVFSTVRPSSYMSGAMASRTEFTQWLGNNSKQGKLVRYVKEIQSHMRLRTSGDRHEIRQQYLPVLWTRLIDRLQKDGKAAVEEVIELMDSYFLTRDDFDYIMELGLGPQDQERVNIETQTKASFTRLYNGQSHPMPFMKASNVIAPQKAAKVVPDLEEAIEEEDDGEIIAEEKPEEEDDEKALKNDKFIKQPKAKKAAAPKKKQSAKKTKKAVDDDEDDDEDDEDVKPKKPTKAKAKAKGKK